MDKCDCDCQVKADTRKYNVILLGDPETGSPGLLKVIERLTDKIDKQTDQIQMILRYTFGDKEADQEGLIKRIQILEKENTKNDGIADLVRNAEKERIRQEGRMQVMKWGLVIPGLVLTILSIIYQIIKLAKGI